MIWHHTCKPGAVWIGRVMVTFVVDGMLGRLAKWLRILGYDTKYSPDWDDNELARIARAEGRVLLTRDVELSRRRGLRFLLVESEDPEEQLVQVARAYVLRADHPFSRCVVCNTLLEDVAKVEAWGQVPSFIFGTQDRFRLCPECNRFYWRGTHWQGMRAKIRALLRDQGI